MTNFQVLREQMVKTQLEERGITDSLVLQAFRRVPRHKFVSPQLSLEAYADHPLPIGGGQTISQPYTVAVMTQALGLKGGEKVLEIGTGSGYQAAILACIAAEVYSVERLPGLAKKAEEKLKKLGFNNVWVKLEDGSLGWQEHSPYQATVVTAGSNRVPQPLLDQLAEGGRLVIPVGDRWLQSLTKITKINGKNFLEENLGGFVFVPLIGDYGWKEGV